MNTHRKISTILLAGVLTAGFALPALAANSNALPQPMREGNVTYISGGIGYDEQHALQSEAKNYDLLISNANKKGQFMTDTDLVIKNKDGREMISVDNTGPLFYAKLSPGEYKVTATNGNQREVRDVKISATKEDHLHLIWQQS